MNITKHFYPTATLRRKILDMKDAMVQIVSPICPEKFWIDWYGAYEIDPKNLVFWICVETDRTKSLLKSNLNLLGELRYLLTRYDYPQQARESVHIDFESQETVDRESGGDWFLHFK